MPRRISLSLLPLLWSTVRSKWLPPEDQTCWEVNPWIWGGLTFAVCMLNSAGLPGIVMRLTERGLLRLKLVLQMLAMYVCAAEHPLLKFTPCHISHGWENKGVVIYEHLIER